MQRAQQNATGWAVMAGLALAAGGAIAQQPVSLGLAALTAIERYPILQTQVQAHYLSSYDRTGGNDDGFNGTYSALYLDARGEHVIFDRQGPGTLYTLWFTSREHGWAPLGWGRIRFYFDNEREPRIDLDADELFGGRTPPFVAPFVFGPTESSGGHVSYVPLPFAERLKITTERRVGFYNAYFHTYDADASVDSWTGQEDASEASGILERVGRDPKPRVPGESVRHLAGSVTLPAPVLPDGEFEPTAATLGSWEGPAVITALRLRPLAPMSAYDLNHVRLRIHWDGQATAAVDAPIGSFFGSGLGEAPVRALPLGMSEAGEYYCYLPMPFWRSAQVELVNETPGETPEIRWEVTLDTANRYREGQAGYFKAHARREWPTTTGQDYTLLDTRGRGVYVGHVMTVEPLRPEVKRWWEGDLRVHLDERRHPAFHGTGHEDDFLGGWSNEWLMNPYTLPLHGQPRTTELRQVDFQWSANTTMYRFFPGGLPYQARARISVEHGSENQVPAMYSSVALYYERPGGLVRLDALDVGDPASEASHDYTVQRASDPVTLSSRFETQTGAPDLVATGRRVAGQSAFTMRREGTSGPLRLRRLYDQSEAQHAEVWIDGQVAGIWYAAAVNAHRRWAETDFLLPVRLTDGKRALEVELRVVEGTWAEFQYELWGIED